MSNRPSNRWRSGRGRSLAGWLAILALLLDGLLPAGFSLASASDAAVIGFCGSAPVPVRKQRPPAAAHCIYCLVAPVGPAPTAMPGLAAPHFVGVVVLPALRGRLINPPAPSAAAQPRGPPVAA